MSRDFTFDFGESVATLWPVESPSVSGGEPHPGEDHDYREVVYRNLYDWKPGADPDYAACRCGQMALRTSSRFAEMVPA